MTKYYFKKQLPLLLALLAASLICSACSACSGGSAYSITHPQNEMPKSELPRSEVPRSEVPKNELAPSTLEQDIVLAEEQLELPFSYVDSAKVYNEILLGYPCKTLVLQLKEPQTVLSSLSGWKEGVLAVGNHYSPPPSWPLTHALGMDAVNAKLTSLLALNPQTSAFLFTGANMDNLVYIEKEATPPSKTKQAPLKIAVLVTAGVQTNALRAGRDSGDYWEPGTINIIILSNRTLGPGAMSNMLITATEAKTAALEDLDIRSSASALPATGTGTDNIIVLAGQGPPAEMSGGHTKLGELLAKAVYQAVIQAIGKQNQLEPNRPIGVRLAEHGIKLEKLLENRLVESSSKQSNPGQKTLALNAKQKEELQKLFEKTMRQPRYAGFMACALSLADSEERGLLPDTSIFSEQCLFVASELAKQPLKKIEPIISNKQLSPLLQDALNALLTGLYYQSFAL